MWLPALAHLQQQMPRAAIGRGSGLGRLGRGAAGGEGWGRGKKGLRQGRGAADLGTVPELLDARFGTWGCLLSTFSCAGGCEVGIGSLTAHLPLPSLAFLQSPLH